MMIRNGKPVKRVTILLDLIERGGENIAVVRVFYFDENEEIYKTEQVYNLSEVSHVLWERDDELARGGVIQRGWQKSEDGVPGFGGSRLWRHKFFYEVEETAKPVSLPN
jgi:hypothetical protein